VTFVAGGDRLEAFQKLLTDYNGAPDNEIYYKFNKINFVSSGEREDGAEGVEGVSASQARAAALADNMAAFEQATGAGRLAPALFRAVRKGMGLTEDAAGVGVVATNRKMAQDPRYSTSMTVDVHPDTPKKNLQAFKL
jgi:hypothetical protein